MFYTSKRMFLISVWILVGVFLIDQKLFAQIAPVPEIGALGQSGIPIQKVYSIDARESNRRAGYFYMLIDKAIFLKKIENNIINTINQQLASIRAFGDGMQSIHCVPKTDMGNSALDRQLININSNVNSSSPIWSSSIQGNDSISIAMLYKIDGTVYFAIRHPLESENKYTDHVPLMRIKSHINLVPLVDTVGNVLQIETRGTVEVSIVYCDCQPWLPDFNPIYSEINSRNFPISMPPTKVDFSKIPEISSILKSVKSARVCEDDNLYYLYLTLMD